MVDNVEMGDGRGALTVWDVKKVKIKTPFYFWTLRISISLLFRYHKLTFKRNNGFNRSL